jgi:hypothetical protein
MIEIDSQVQALAIYPPADTGSLEVKEAEPNIAHVIPFAHRPAG